jgi:hypothetical protein
MAEAICMDICSPSLPGEMGCPGAYHTYAGWPAVSGQESIEEELNQSPRALNQR